MSISISNDAIQSLFERHRKLSISTKSAAPLHLEEEEEEDDHLVNGQPGDGSRDATAAGATTSNNNEVEPIADGPHIKRSDSFLEQPHVRRQSTAASARSMSLMQPLERFDDGAEDTQGVHNDKDAATGLTSDDGSPAAFSLMRLDSFAPTAASEADMGGDGAAGGGQGAVVDTFGGGSSSSSSSAAPRAADRGVDTNASVVGLTDAAGENPLAMESSRSASMWNGRDGKSASNTVAAAATRSLSMAPASTGRHSSLGQLVQQRSSPSPPGQHHQSVSGLDQSDLGSITPAMTTPVANRAPPNTAAPGNGNGERFGGISVGASSSSSSSSSSAAAATTPPALSWREAEDREVEDVAVNRVVLLPEAAEAVAAAHAATDAAAPFPFQSDAYPFPLSDEVEQYAIGGNRSEALSFPLVAPARCDTALLLRQELERLLSLVSRGHPFSDDAVVVKSRHEVEEDCRAYDASLLLASAASTTASATSPPAEEVAEAAGFLQTYLPKADTQRADRVSVIREFQQRHVAKQASPPPPSSSSQKSHGGPGEIKVEAEGNPDSGGGGGSAMVLLQISRFHSMLDGLLERLFFPWRHAPNATLTPGIMEASNPNGSDESGAAPQAAFNTSEHFEEGHSLMPPIGSNGSNALEPVAKELGELRVSTDDASVDALDSLGDNARHERGTTFQNAQAITSADSSLARRPSDTRANSLGRSGRFALGATTTSSSSDSREQDGLGETSDAQSPRSFSNRHPSYRAQGRGNFALRSRFGRPASTESPARALNEVVRPVADTARYDGWSTVRADAPARSESHSARRETKFPDWEWRGNRSNNNNNTTTTVGVDRGVWLPPQRTPFSHSQRVGARTEAEEDDEEEDEDEEERVRINRQAPARQVAKKPSLRYGLAGPRGYFELVVRSRDEAANSKVQVPARLRHLESDQQQVATAAAAAAAGSDDGSPAEHVETTSPFYEDAVSSPRVRVRGRESLRMEEEAREREAHTAALEAEERHRRRKGSRLDGLPTADSTVVVVGDGTRQGRGPRRRARPQLNVFADHVIPELIVDLDNAFYSDTNNDTNNDDDDDDAAPVVSPTAVRRAMRDLRDFFTNTPHTADSHWPLARAEAARIEEMDRTSGYYFHGDEGGGDAHLDSRNGGAASTGNDALPESLVSKLVTILALVRVPQTRDFLLARLRRWWAAKRRLAGHVHLPSGNRSRNVHAAQTRVLEDAVALELGNVAQALEEYEKRYNQRGTSSSRSIDASPGTTTQARANRGEEDGKPAELLRPPKVIPNAQKKVPSRLTQLLDVDDARDYNGVQGTAESTEGDQELVQEISTVLSASAAAGAASAGPGALLDPMLEDALRRAKQNLSADKVGVRDF